MAVTPRQSAWIWKNGKRIKVKPGTQLTKKAAAQKAAERKAAEENIDPNEKLKKAQEKAERKKKRQKTIENIGNLGAQLASLDSGTPSSKSKVPKSHTVVVEEVDVKSTVKKLTKPKVIPTQQQTDTNTELQISASKPNRDETKTEEDEEEKKKKGGRRRSKRRRQ